MGSDQLQPSSFYAVCFAVDQRPALDRPPIACFPISVFRFKREARINDEVERSFVFKTDVNRVVLAGGEDLDKIDRLAFDFFKAVERASTVSADCGLAALGFGVAQGLRNPLSFSFFGIGMFAP